MNPSPQLVSEWSPFSSHSDASSVAQVFVSDRHTRVSQNRERSRVVFNFSFLREANRRPNTMSGDSRWRKSVGRLVTSLRRRSSQKKKTENDLLEENVKESASIVRFQGVSLQWLKSFWEDIKAGKIRPDCKVVRATRDLAPVQERTPLKESVPQRTSRESEPR